MLCRRFALAVAIALTAFSAIPVTAKTITIPIHWSVQRNELSIARLRLYLAPKLRKDVCAKLGSSLRAGNTVKVVLYGAGDEILSTFTYDKGDCV